VQLQILHDRVPLEDDFSSAKRRQKCWALIHYAFFTNWASGRIASHKFKFAFRIKAEKSEKEARLVDRVDKINTLSFVGFDVEMCDRVVPQVRPMRQKLWILGGILPIIVISALGNDAEVDYGGIQILHVAEVSYKFPSFVGVRFGQKYRRLVFVIFYPHSEVQCD
jgi:hypothetical protein